MKQHWYIITNYNLYLIEIFLIFFFFFLPKDKIFLFQVLFSSLKSHPEFHIKFHCYVCLGTGWGVTVSLTCLAVDVSDSFEEHLSSMWRMPVSLYFIFSLMITLGLCVLEENRGKVPRSSYRIKDSCYHLDEAAFGRLLHWKVFLFPCPYYPLWKEFYAALT